MVLAIPAGMIHADNDTTRYLSSPLLATALSAVPEASRQVPQTGHA